MGLRSKSLFRQAADTLSHFYKPCFEVNVWYTRAILGSIHHSAVEHIVFVWNWWKFDSQAAAMWVVVVVVAPILSLCVQENGEWGVKRGDRAVFPPSPLKIFPFKNIFQDLHFRRWTADRVGQVAPSVLTPLFPQFFWWKITNLKVCLTTRPISNHQPASSQVQHPSSFGAKNQVH